MTTVDPADRRRWEDDGWCVLGGLFDQASVAAAASAVEALFPSAARMAGGGEDPALDRWRDWDARWPEFPFASPALNRLVVGDALIDLAETLIGVEDVRLYMGIVSAKYAGQPSGYNQLLHTDFPNHTLTVPSPRPGFHQLELFVYLCDVTAANGATRFVSRRRTAGVPVEQHTLNLRDYAELYDDPAEASGPAGSVVAYRPDVYHRSVDFDDPTQSRFMLHVGYRAASMEWGGYQAWQFRGFSPELHDFVQQATPRQLGVMGFPPPGHPFWTEATLAGVGRRYPGLDLSPWRARLGDPRRGDPHRGGSRS